MKKKIWINNLNNIQTQDHWALPNAEALALLCSQNKMHQLIIARNSQEAHHIHHCINFFTPETPCSLFEDWETLPFDHFSPHDNLTSSRLRLLYTCLQQQPKTIVVAIQTLMHQVCPRDWIAQSGFNLRIGQQFDPDIFTKQLLEFGYRRVDQVTAHGEFAKRGAIIDCYPMGHDQAIRIDYFDDTIDGLRTFDPNSQRSLHQHSKVELLPAKEYPLDNDSNQKFRQRFRQRFEINPSNCEIYNQISQGEAAAGAEYYLALFFNQLDIFLNYLKPETHIIYHQEIKHSMESFYQSAKERENQYKHDNQRPILSTDDIFISPETCQKAINSFQTHTWCNQKLNNKTLKSTPSIAIKSSQLKKEALADIQKQSKKIIFSAITPGRCDRLQQQLLTMQIHASIHSNWNDINTDQKDIVIACSPLLEGFSSVDNTFALIPERHYHDQPIQHCYKKKHIADGFIRELSELEVGQCVVHRQHGIGRYLGLERVETSHHIAEYLMLEYADQDKIYVPINNLNLISQYTQAGDANIALHSLNSKRWQKEKAKAKEKIRDVAAELLKIYSQRQAATGFSHQSETNGFQQFRDAFEFQETPDQTRAINEVIHDMSQPKCMDRLICGDVGFGKTEVAMQAACLAALNQKQVAMLVPTTLLCQQHFDNFINRFVDMPIKIESLSRFQTPKQTKAIIEGLNNGTIDIVIGTHRLLQPNIQFKNLGLLIIDEEHRFGVKQKDKIKAIKNNVDIITLTATPIPRTLNLSLSAFRDLSLITTPPQRRLPIKTFISPYRKALVQEAIAREIQRGGQVYYLFNEVAKMAEFAEELKKIIPNVSIGVAHAQMPMRQLERSMDDFYNQRHHILLCSTIIETGIDIERANTILIHRADRFGLAQLHQLRGRVGRSHHQAYAYLFTPPEQNITPDAQKRLDAIAHLQDLGSGFILANHDLEIRGAGSLLGQAQSGQIESIGFSLYMDLLDEAVANLDASRPKSPKTTEMELPISLLFPEDYIPDVGIRLCLYKQLADHRIIEKIEQFREEVVDRFGPLPQAAQQLFDSAVLRCHATTMGINKITVGQQYLRLHFGNEAQINTQKLLSLIQTRSKTFQLEKKQTLKVLLNKDKPLIDTIKNIIEIIK